MIRVWLLWATMGLTLLAAETALAGFPGTPGPIAYSKQTYDIISGGRDIRPSAVGGIFTHGPRIRQQARQLTTSFYDQEPSYSSDGRWIVFVGFDAATAGGGIYLMRSDGSERRLVIADGSHPAFFPSGGAIAFVRIVDGRQQIFTVRLDGSGLRQLTAGPSESSDPAVSPNGGRIAFASDRDRSGRDRSDIYIMRPTAAASTPRSRVRAARSNPTGHRMAAGSPMWSAAAPVPISSSPGPTGAARSG